VAKSIRPGRRRWRWSPTASQCTVAIACPADITVTATGPAGAVVNYPAPTVIGNWRGRSMWRANPPSGSTFPDWIDGHDLHRKRTRWANSAHLQLQGHGWRKPKPGFFPNPLLPAAQRRLYQPAALSSALRQRHHHPRHQATSASSGASRRRLRVAHRFISFGSVVELEHSHGRRGDLPKKFSAAGQLHGARHGELAPETF